MLWHSEVIADLVESIFSLVQEGGHFLRKQIHHQGAEKFLGGF